MHLFFTLFSLLVFSLFSNSAQAEERIAVLDNDYAVIFDDFDWKCETVFEGYQVNRVAMSFLKGTSNFLPIEFQFLRLIPPSSLPNKESQAAAVVAKSFLSLFAKKQKALFSNLEKGKATKTRYSNETFHTLKGSFADNDGSGRFIVYTKPSTHTSEPWFCHFVKIYGIQDGVLADELFHTTLEMISPVISES